MVVIAILLLISCFSLLFITSYKWEKPRNTSTHYNYITWVAFYNFILSHVNILFISDNMWRSLIDLLTPNNWKHNWIFSGFTSLFYLWWIDRKHALEIQLQQPLLFLIYNDIRILTTKVQLKFTNWKNVCFRHI